MTNIKAVVFDMDGVILDSEAVYDICWRIEAEKRNISNIDYVHRLCLGKSKKDSISIMKNFYGENFDGDSFWAATDSYCEQLEKEKGVPLKPYSEEILVYLKQRGYALALASSTYRATVERQLSRSNLLRYFNQVVCGDEVKSAKPDPAIYITACNKLNISPFECVAVEDSPNGIKSAYNAGLKCIMIPDRIPPSDEEKPLLWKLCSNLSELMNIL